MPSTLFDLEVTVRSTERKKGLSDYERNILFEKPKIKERKDKEAGQIPTAGLAPEEIDLLEPLDFPDIISGYSEVIEAAEAHLKNIRERSNALVLEFDPEERVELAEATNRIFQGSNTKITYAMYLEALKLDKDISVELAEQSHGITR